MRYHTKLIQKGDFVAEVNVELIEREEGWSPYISVSDAYKLDGIRDALQKGDIRKASQFGRIFRLTPVVV